MGWMHDTLGYFARDPIHRRYHQDELTFSMLYEHTEHFIMPLSHDEVVHGKGSLLGKMAGDAWQKFANLRLLLAYQYTRPGKMLLFMGTELAPDREWDHDRSLDWHLAADPMRAAFMRFMEELGRVYRESACLWRSDPDPAGFRWIDCQDRDNSVFSYVRQAGSDHLVVICNLTPVIRHHYRVGVPKRGEYARVLSTDDAGFGGSGVEPLARITSEDHAAHGFPQSISLVLPPLAALVLAPVR
jgi:1,4-alpha-glucan branching enzyme